MIPQRFALIAGLLFLVLGILSLIPALNFYPPDGLRTLNFDYSYGYFLNVLPLNIFNKALLIILGFWGIFAYTRPGTFLPASIRFSRVVFVIMGSLAFLGMLPQSETLFGYAPLYGSLILFHGIAAVLGAYYGYGLTSKVAEWTMPNA